MHTKLTSLFMSLATVAASGCVDDTVVPDDAELAATEQAISPAS